MDTFGRIPTSRLAAFLTRLFPHCGTRIASPRMVCELLECSLGLFPSGRPDWVLPSALLFGARTFLQPYSLTSAVARPPRPRRILPRRLGFFNPLVESHVHQLVRAAILLATDVADGDPVAELLQELRRLLVQLLQLGFFHPPLAVDLVTRSEEHTSELQSHSDLVCRLLLAKRKTHVLRAT